MPKTTAERQRKFKAKRAADGKFKRYDFWVHPNDLPAMRAVEERLRRLRLEAGV